MAHGERSWRWVHLRRMAAMSVRMEAPKMRASPLVGVSMPVRMEIAVVLPAPLWPARAK